MTMIVAGGAGFVGSNLIGRLLQSGERVVAIDNLSRGSLQWIEQFLSQKNFTFLEADLASPDFFEPADASIGGEPISDVWHLAANSDIPAGVRDPQVDLKATFLTTFHLLNYMRVVGAKRMLFASSSAIYGDFGEEEISEKSAPTLPISNYGAMKLASEAQISAAAESHLEQVQLFRFPNVVGFPATHGVIFDFIRKLKTDPSQLHVLGDGTQQKSYMHVSDLVDAMLHAAGHFKQRRVVLNIGPVDDGVTVRWIAEQVVARVAPRARMEFGQGNRGWVGDVPRFRYSVAQLSQSGWRPKRGSEEAILEAIDEIARQEGF